MKLYYWMLTLLLLVPSSHALSAQSSFVAECKEGSTHRYDGGNGVDMNGVEANFAYGWSTEKWGGLRISWSGGETIKLGELEATVLSARDGVVSAAWAKDNGLAHNIYSFVIDTSLGQAVYSQVKASSLGKSRSVKVRSQDLKCIIE